ncbi:putative transcription factor bHLH041 isoform X2 [Trifolium pratense]|uniref:putative transcription factor bHLH041 isoform X2 n=1 Tax=Trifolium pratense TaxID=57577 RepID=UPI001E693D4B|nr:putative transcription factor bHLH041 isoform X2 [Trifolium pratense]
MYHMEGVFSLPIAVRTEFIHTLMQSLGGCCYICLWAYNTILPNRLSFLDGFYNVLNNQIPSSSLGSVAQQLFNQYRILSFDVNDDCVPGLAFRNQQPYLELQQLELFALSTTEIQTQFYQEARIKTAVFMGCNKGEIELGFLNMSQVDIQTALSSLFPEDFSRQTQQIIDQNTNPPSSSSSSMRSLSAAGSPEYSSLIFNNIPTGRTSPSQFPPDHTHLGGSIIPPMRPISNTLPLQLQHQQFPQITPTQLFSTTQMNHQNDAIMRAIQNVISTPPSQRNLHGVHQEASAFGRNLNLMRLRDRSTQAMRPSSNQLHHMISERRRREKLNENFQALRALLPQGTKKDKASILITAKETLRSLMAEIDKLSKRNHELMSQQLPAANKESTKTKEIIKLSSNERLNVQILHVPESSSLEDEPMIVDLQVNVMGQISQVDMLIRLLEFLNQVQHVNLLSMDATNTNNAQGDNSIHQITFRLRITQECEWDEEAFQEAVRRVVADLMHSQVD